MLRLDSRWYGNQFSLFKNSTIFLGLTLVLNIRPGDENTGINWKRIVKELNDVSTQDTILDVIR